MSTKSPSMKTFSINPLIKLVNRDNSNLNKKINKKYGSITE